MSLDDSLKKVTPGPGSYDFNKLTNTAPKYVYDNLTLFNYNW